MTRMTKRPPTSFGGHDCALQARRFWRKVAVRRFWFLAALVAMETICGFWPKMNRRRCGPKTALEVPGFC
jgi:hypothetical protein